MVLPDEVSYPHSIDVLEAEALSLPQADRSRLIDRLFASLEKDPEREAEWSSEAGRREERIARGETAWVAGHEAVARRAGVA